MEVSCPVVILCPAWVLVWCDVLQPRPMTLDLDFTHSPSPTTHPTSCGHHPQERSILAACGGKYVDDTVVLKIFSCQEKSFFFSLALFCSQFHAWNVYVFPKFNPGNYFSISARWSGIISPCRVESESPELKTPEPRMFPGRWLPDGGLGWAATTKESNHSIHFNSRKPRLN